MWIFILGFILGHWGLFILGNCTLAVGAATRAKSSKQRAQWAADFLVQRFGGWGRYKWRLAPLGSILVFVCGLL